MLFASLAFPGVETKERIDLLLQVALAKYAEDTLTSAIPAVNPSSGLRYPDELFTKSSAHSTLLQHRDLQILQPLNAIPSVAVLRAQLSTKDFVLALLW